MLLRAIAEAATFGLVTTALQHALAMFDRGTTPTVRQVVVALIAYSLAFFYAKVTGIGIRTLSESRPVRWLAEAVVIGLAVGAVLLFGGP